MTRQALYRLNHVLQGLCPVCPNPVLPGHHRCAEHLKLQRQYREKEIQLRRLEHRWVTCGCPLDDEIDGANIVCFNCSTNSFKPRRHLGNNSEVYQ